MSYLPFVSQHWGHSLTWIHFTKYLLSASCSDKAGGTILILRCYIKKKNVTPQVTHICFYHSLKPFGAMQIDSSILFDIEKDNLVNGLSYKLSVQNSFFPNSVFSRFEKLQRKLHLYVAIYAKCFLFLCDICHAKELCLYLACG